jgi:uncharacterized protein DUF1003
VPAHNTTITLDDARGSASASELHHPPTIPPPILDASQRQELEDRISGAITDFAGSMRFVYIHTLWFGLWIIVNAGLFQAIGLHIIPFDPFPFGLLTLVVSLEAIYLSTFVMIAQNRQSAVADARAQADYAVNVRGRGGDRQAVAPGTGAGGGRPATAQPVFEQRVTCVSRRELLIM